MEIYQTQALLFKTLMHPTRLAILDILRNGEQCVCHMEAVFGMRQAHISQHLMVLRDAGLVADRREGWNIFYRVVRPEIYQVMDSANVFYEATRSIQFGNIQSNVRFSVKQSACPCPKCNPGVESIHHETPDQDVNRIETTV